MCAPLKLSDLQPEALTLPDGSASLLLKKPDGTTQSTAADGTVTTSINGPDPRFGMQAPLTTSATIRTPSGLTGSMTATRQATLSNPDDLMRLKGPCSHCFPRG